VLNQKLKARRRGVRCCAVLHARYVVLLTAARADACTRARAHTLAQPWTGSRPQVSALLSGTVKKKKAKEVYDTTWDLIVSPPDGVQPSVTLPAHSRLGVGDAFLLNFQARAARLRCTFTRAPRTPPPDACPPGLHARRHTTSISTWSSIRRARTPQAATPFTCMQHAAALLLTHALCAAAAQEFYAYDMQDAITQMFVYLTTMASGIALVKGLPAQLGGMWASATKVGTELRKGNFQAACAGAADVHASGGKMHGGTVSANAMGGAKTH
jgi:hypothetical protein